MGLKSNLLRVLTANGAGTGGVPAVVRQCALMAQKNPVVAVLERRPGQ